MISKTRGVSILEILITLAIVLVLLISAIFFDYLGLSLVLLFIFLIANIIVIGKIIKYIKQVVGLRPNVPTIDNEPDNHINQIPQNTTSLPFTFGEIAIILALWFIAVALGIGGIINWILELIFITLGGWAIFIVDRIPIVLENQLLIWWGIIYFIGFIITTHVFLSWLYQQWYKPANAAWRLNWSLWLGLGIITSFSNGIAVSGLIHQIGWLLNTDDPFIIDISRGYDQVSRSSYYELSWVQDSVNYFYAQHGRLPLNNAAAGLPEPASVTDNRYISSVEITNGKVTITYGNKANYILHGKTIDIVPYKNGRFLEWVCGNAKPPTDAIKIPNVPANSSTMETHFMPVKCRP